MYWCFERGVFMKKIIDIYGSYIEANGEVKPESEWYGRAYQLENNIIIGTADHLKDYGHFLIFGKQEGNEIHLTRCMMNGNPSIATEFHVSREDDKKNTYLGDSTLRCHTINSDMGKCKLYVLPAEKTREIRSEEHYILTEEICDCLAQLSNFQGELYENFIQTKEKKNKKGNIQKVYSI